jgi:hypothetical protein
LIASTQAASKVITENKYDFIIIYTAVVLHTELSLFRPPYPIQAEESHSEGVAHEMQD